MSKRLRRKRRDPVRAVPKSTRSPLEKAVTTGAIAAGLAALAAPAADAATFTVLNTNDSGAGSLRDAIVTANNTPGPDVITFNPSVTGTITLTSGQLYISDDLDVQGPGVATLTISGNNSSRVFYMYNSDTLISVTLSGLTITQGAAAIGGGVVNFGENLTLDHVAITNSTSSGLGGGVATGGIESSLTVLDSTISGNSAALGGGIYFYDSASPTLIQDSVISGNQSSGAGGGIFFYGPDYDVTIRRTTISGNNAGGFGGGIYFYDTDGGDVIIEDSTISGNTAMVGGGIYFYNVDDPVTITNSTISGNSADNGGGIVFYGSGLATFTVNSSTISGNIATIAAGNFASFTNTVTLNDTIVADGTAAAAPDLYGGPFIANYSLIETPGLAMLTAGPGTVTGVDPQLGPLQNNGGPTETKLPAPTSPVINAGDPAFVPPPATDQRGFPRVSAGRIDIGAVEVQGGAFQFSAPTYSVAENGGTVTITVTRTGGTDPATVNYATSNGSATAGADYTAASGTLTFTAGQTSTTFSVTILDDALVEGNETFNVGLSGPSAGATLGATPTAVVTITDFEPGQLQFSTSTANVNENGGSILITVTRTGGGNGPVSASYTTNNGSATAGADYTTTAGTVNFADGDTAPKTFSVPILNDALTEGNETFTVTLSAPTGGATLGSPSTETVTIIDNAPPGSVQFSTAINTVPESAGTVTLTITRTGGSSGPLTVTYTTNNGTATAPSDYTATTNTVTFAAGDTTPKTINIPIISDAIPEPPESFTVTLSNPTAGTLGAQSTTTVTITPPLEEIPVLGPIGKLLLALSTMASALWIMGRRRFFGFLFAAAMIGMMTGSLQAATTTATAASGKTAHPRLSDKFGGQFRGLTKSKVTGVLAEVTVGDKSTTLKLTSGMSVSIANATASVNLQNGNTAALNALAAGQKVRIVTMTDPKGTVMRVKVKIKK